MNTKLIVIRIKSLAWELGALAGASLVAFSADFLSSAPFLSYVTSNWGEGAVGGIILMIASAVVKHIRNLQIVKNLGSESDESVFI